MSFLKKATILLSETYKKVDDNYNVNMQSLPKHIISILEDAGCKPDETDLILFMNDIITDNDGSSYRVIDLLGTGSFSKVYKCEVVGSPGKMIAIKIARSVERFAKRLENEFNVIKQLQSGEDEVGIKTINKVYKFFFFSGHACVTMEICVRPLLHFINLKCEKIPFVRSVMAQLLHALKHIHSNNLSHCDIKSDNIMMLSEGSYEIRLIDFGSTQELTGAKMKLPQPDIYKSPEALLDLGLTKAIDIWAAGCVAAEMVLGFHPFGFESQFDIITALDGLVGPIPQKMLAISKNSKMFFMQTTHGYIPMEETQSVIFERHANGPLFVEGNLAANLKESLRGVPEAEACINFIMGLLNPDPEERLTAEEALQHPFIKNINNIAMGTITDKIKVGVVGSTIHIIPPLSPLFEEM